MATTAPITRIPGRPRTRDINAEHVTEWLRHALAKATNGRLAAELYEDLADERNWHWQTARVYLLDAARSLPLYRARIEHRGPVVWSLRRAVSVADQAAAAKRRKPATPAIKQRRTA